MSNPNPIRGAVRDWPAVRAATSPQALANYLRGFDTGGSADTMHGDPSIGGRFFYNADLSGQNFERNSMPLARSLDRLLDLIDEPAPPALYVGALAAPAALPGFAQQKQLRAGRRHRADQRTSMKRPSATRRPLSSASTACAPG
jgi:hypothetical protein